MDSRVPYCDTQALQERLVMDARPRHFVLMEQQPLLPLGHKSWLQPACASPVASTGHKALPVSSYTSTGSGALPR